MRSIEKYEKDYLKYEKPENLFEELYQVKYRQKNVNKQIKKYKPQSVLEIGCGMNSQANVMSEVVEEYTIVEPGHKFIEQAKKDLEDKNIMFVEGMVEEKIKDLRSRKYDFVILGSLLHEIENPKEFLEAIKELCDKDTVIHVNVPNAKSIHRLLAMESGIISEVYCMTQRNVEMQQNSVFDMNSLKKLIENTGAKILEEGSYFIKPFTHGQMMRCLNEGILDDRVMDGFENMIKWMPEYGSEIFVNFKWI